MKIEVKSCAECPFCNNDNEYGRDACNLDIDIYTTNNSEQLPEDAVHDKCPLKKEDYIIGIVR